MWLFKTKEPSPAPTLPAEHARSNYWQLIVNSKDKATIKALISRDFFPPPACSCYGCRNHDFYKPLLSLDDEEILDTLFEKNLLPQDRLKDDLRFSVQRGRIHTTRWLINKIGKNFDDGEESLLFNTVKHHFSADCSFASYNHSVDHAMLNLLITQGCDINARDKHGKTMLFLTQQHAPSVFQQIINNGIQLHASDSNLLLKEAQEKRFNLIKPLLAAGADINACDAKGYTALVYAAKFKRLDAMTTLMNAGADIEPLRLYFLTEGKPAEFKDATGNDLVEAMLASLNPKALYHNFALQLQKKTTALSDRSIRTAEEQTELESLIKLALQAAEASAQLAHIHLIETQNPKNSIRNLAPLFSAVADIAASTKEGVTAAHALRKMAANLGDQQAQRIVTLFSTTAKENTSETPALKRRHSFS